jgi:hypothetical protein
MGIPVVGFVTTVANCCALIWYSRPHSPNTPVFARPVASLGHKYFRPLRTCFALLDNSNAEADPWSVIYVTVERDVRHLDNRSIATSMKRVSSAKLASQFRC